MFEAAADIRDLHLHLHNEQLSLDDETDEAFQKARESFMSEEFYEMLVALEDDDQVGLLHEGLDVIVTVLGTLIARGFTPQEIAQGWSTIWEANMQKTHNPRGGKWIKPPGWQKPDLSDIIKRDPE